MKLDTVIQRIPYWYAAGKSVHLKSAPGRGKTTTIEGAPKQLSERTHKNIGMVIINGAMLTPMDVLGYGIPKHHDTGHSSMVFTDPFFWVTREGKRLTEYDGGIVFVDEADKADVDVKKVLGEGALSGRFGPHKLPPGWIMWSAGNRTEDRSGSTKELDHLINRRMEIDITDDLESLTNWMTKNSVSPLTIAFSNSNPQIVLAEKVPDKQGPWCTPRSMVQADQYMQLVASENNGQFQDDSTIVEEVAGMIGQGSAAQFFASVRLEREMPKFDKIIADPTKCKIPEKPDAQMLVCYTLAHRVSKETASPVITYVERMPKEFAVTFAKAACNRDASLVTTQAFNKWALNNASLMAAIAR
jgi:hypothetical protein